MIYNYIWYLFFSAEQRYDTTIVQRITGHYLSSPSSSIPLPPHLLPFLPLLLTPSTHLLPSSISLPISHSIPHSIYPTHTWVLNQWSRKWRHMPVTRHEILLWRHQCIQMSTATGPDAVYECGNCEEFIITRSWFFFIFHSFTKPGVIFNKSISLLEEQCSGSSFVRSTISFK